MAIYVLKSVSTIILNPMLNYINVSYQNSNIHKIITDNLITNEIIFVKYAINLFCYVIEYFSIKKFNIN
jgi:hypothetical protein